MILYDHHKKILAINDQTLEMLGYQSLEKFRQEVYDVAQLFVKRPGYLHEFRSFHWIDYVLTNTTVTHRAILRTKTGKEIETFVNVNQLSALSGMLSYYLVTFELNTYNECGFGQTLEQPEVSSTQEPQTTTSSTEATVEKIALQPGQFEEPNLEQISEELNLGADIIEDFIKEYIKHALEKLPTINEAILHKNQKQLYENIHTLKGVAANLRLQPAFEILAKMKKDTPLEDAVEILEEFYSYILFLAKRYGIEVPQELYLQLPSPRVEHTPSQPAQAPQPSQAAQNAPRRQTEPPKESGGPTPPPQQAAKELGLSVDEYQEYLKELINEIKLNLAYNNFNELHKLASFARNLYLQECAKYLDQVNINQNPELVKKCINDLEELKKAPNPFIVTLDDLKDALNLVQIDKDDFIDIIEDLIVELKTLHSIKMKREKFLKKAKQLKSVAESLRLSNLVLLLNNIISTYPLDEYTSKQLEEAIESLETNIKQL